LTAGDKKKLVSNIKFLDNILKKHNKPRSKYSHLNKDEMCEHIIDVVDCYNKEKEKTIINDIVIEFNSISNMNPILKNVEET
jgi:hypothetical protein